MALPQKVADRLQWEAPQTQGWSGRLVMFCATLFIIALAGWIGLRFGYQPYLEAQKTKNQTEIDKFSKDVPVSAQASLFLTYAQVVNLKTLTASHAITSLFFTWLEQNTQQNIFYTKMAFDGVKRVVTLSGMGRTNQDIEQQLEIFRQDKRVRDVSISSLVETKEGGHTFDMILTLDPSLLGVVISKSTTSTQIR